LEETKKLGDGDASDQARRIVWSYGKSESNGDRPVGWRRYEEGSKPGA
jgi:hypothetical protein